MNNLNLPKPRLIDEAVPANRYCGLDENERQDAVVVRDTTHPVRNEISPQDLVADAKQHITEVNVTTAKQLLAEGNIVLVDTREESEYAAGHINNALLLPRGVLEFKIGNSPELADKSKAVLILLPHRWTFGIGGANDAAVRLSTMSCPWRVALKPGKKLEILKMQGAWMQDLKLN